MVTFNINSEQKEYWNDKGQLWVNLQPRIDNILSQFNHKVMTVIGIEFGDRVLEIGCGTGTSTLAPMKVSRDFGQNP